MEAFMAIVDAVDRDNATARQRAARRALQAVEALNDAIDAAGIHAPALRLDLASAVLRALCKIDATMEHSHAVPPRRSAERYFEATGV
jgi:hypothetical protein